MYIVRQILCSFMWMNSIRLAEVVIKTADLIKAVKPMGFEVYQDKINDMVISKDALKVRDLEVDTPSKTYLVSNIYILVLLI